MMGHHSMELSVDRAGRPSPFSDFSWFGSRAASLTQKKKKKKKKKKKWREAEVGPNHNRPEVPARQPLSNTWGLPPLVSGLMVVAGSWDPSWCSRPAVAVVAQQILQQRHAWRMM